MPTPQDDDFSGPTLDTKWTFYPTSPGGNGSYSFVTNPGNITLSVPNDATLALTLNAAISLRQPQVAAQYLVEAGFTASGISINGQESGIFVAKSGDPTTFVLLAKKMVGGVSQVHALHVVAGVLIGQSSVSFLDDTNIILRITRYGGNFAFSYKREDDAVFVAVPFTAAESFGSTEFGLASHCSAGTAFDTLVNYFHARTLTDISVNADVLLRIGNTQITNADISLDVRIYPPVRQMKVLQHFEAPINTLEWKDGVLLSPTIASPNGTLWSVFVDNGGAIGTLPGISASNSPVYISDSFGNVWELGVANDGAFTIERRFGIDPNDVVLILLTAPDLTTYFITITYADPLTLTGPAITTIATTLNSSGIIIVRKEGSFPKTETDGAVIYTGPSLGTFDDGPIESRARQFYSIFTVYTDKTSIPTSMATLPIFVNIYRDSGHRFSRKFKGGIWWMFYSISKVIQLLVDTDIPAALGQFNIKTASGVFLELWGKLFGARRYPSENDAQFSDRVITRVLLGRTVPSVIRSEVLKIPGVIFCEIADSTSGSMFIGYSFIGFAGNVENPEQSDFITPIFYDNPFFFTVRVKIKQGTNLDQIIKTVQDNKAAGTRFTVEILEILP